MKENLTQEQIANYSKVIANFMGSAYINKPYRANKEDKGMTDFWHWSKPVTGFPRCCVTGTEWSTAYMIGNFKYHCSFDWLMPVASKLLNGYQQNPVFRPLVVKLMESIIDADTEGAFSATYTIINLLNEMNPLYTKMKDSNGNGIFVGDEIEMKNGKLIKKG